MRRIINLIIVGWLYQHLLMCLLVWCLNSVSMLLNLCYLAYNSVKQMRYTRFAALLDRQIRILGLKGCNLQMLWNFNFHRLCAVLLYLFFPVSRCIFFPLVPSVVQFGLATSHLITCYNCSEIGIFCLRKSLFVACFCPSIGYFYHVTYNNLK